MDYKWLSVGPVAKNSRRVLRARLSACLLTNMDRKVDHIRRCLAKRLNKLVVEASLQTVKRHRADCLGFAAGPRYGALTTGRAKLFCAHPTYSIRFSSRQASSCIS